MRALDKRITALLGIRPGERLRVGLMFLYFFLVITSYYVIKPVRNSLFIERLGADNLPYVYIGAALFVGIIISFYSRFADRVSRQALVLGTFGLLASNLLLFWWALRSETLLTSGAFYIWAKLYPLLLVSQFWLVANELFTTPQAKRVFGFIGAGGIVGGIAGSAIAGAFATLVGSAQLLLVSVGILGASAVLLVVIDRVAEPVAAAPRAAGRERTRGAWILLRESSHLRTIAYILGLTIIVSTIVDWQFNKAIELFIGGEDAKTAFFGRFFAVLNIVSVVIQLLFTSWVLRVFGIGIALILLPLGLLTGSLGIIIHPGLWTAAFAKGAEGSLRYSLDQSTRELLFLPVPSELKYRGKPLIDMVVYRGGTGIAGVIVLVATSLLSFGLREMAILASVLVGLWLGVTVAMRREFRASVRRMIDTRDVEPRELIGRHLDAASRAELREALNSQNENAVLYALELLDGIEGEAIASRASHLLEHGSEQVRARTLRALYSHGNQAEISDPQQLLSDASMQVRVEAINYVCNFGPLPPVEQMEDFLRSSEPEVRSAALACLAQHADSQGAATATKLLAEMAQQRDGPQAAAERRLAAEAIGLLEGKAQITEILAGLLLDPEPMVRRAAVQAAVRLKRPELVPHLLSQLCCRGARPDARAALAAYGRAIYDELARALRDPEVPLDVRTSIPAVFYETVSQAAVDTLVDVLPEVPPPVRRSVLKSLNRMRRNHEGLRFDPQTLELVLRAEVRNAYQLVADRLAVAPESLLGQVLRESQTAAFERVSRTLALLYPLRDIFAAYQGLSSSSETAQSAGLELLESTLSLQHRRLVGPLADSGINPEERVRIGAGQFEDVGVEDRDRVVERLVQQSDEPWLATVAAVARGVEPVGRQQAVREPFHLHSLPRGKGSLAALLAGDRQMMLKLVERADFLRGADLFSKVRTEDLAKIAVIAQEREYGESEVLFREGDEGSELFLIVTGQVRATRRGETAFVADRGETVGTLTLIDARPREFTATATRHTRVLVIERDDFYDLMHDHFDLAEGLLVHLTEVVRKLNQEIEAVAVEL